MYRKLYININLHYTLFALFQLVNCVHILKDVYIYSSCWRSDKTDRLPENFAFYEIFYRDCIAANTYSNVVRDFCFNTLARFVKEMLIEKKNVCGAARLGKGVALITWIRNNFWCKGSFLPQREKFCDLSSKYDSVLLQTPKKHQENKYFISFYS